MRERIALIGFDEPEIQKLKSQLNASVIAHPTLPGYVVCGGELLIDPENGGWKTSVDRVLFHGIFENDFDFIVALNLWGGPCLPGPRGMLDCRNKHACLVRALAETRFPGSGRGFVPAGENVTTRDKTVAKWGNWHCGENKALFSGEWRAEFSSTTEPYFDGRAMRVVVIGGEVRQILLDGDDWKKSIHGQAAEFVDVDSELADDTRALAKYFGLEVIANDYIVGTDEKFLLEVNHIPNVTRFSELWNLYEQYALDWCFR